MSTPKQTSIKFFTSLLLIAFFTSLGFCYKYYKTNKNLEESNLSNKENILNLQSKLDSVVLKSIADELFINGYYDSAMQAYKKMPQGEHESSFLADRRRIMDNMNGFRNSLNSKVKNAEIKAKEGQNMYGLQLASLRLQYERTNDSLKTTYNKKLQALENKIIEKEKELSNAPTPKLGRLTFYNSNGTKISYFGEYYRGKANGQGVGSHSTGSVYDGEWKDNKKHGTGTYKWREGEIYEGEFVNDRREGKGTYFWPNGNRYEGQWKADVRDGEGTLYDKDNKVLLKGLWKNDELANKTTANQ
ncbi:MAG: MORN repeat-containing protein [Cytophagaceae bacterium]